MKKNITRFFAIVMACVALTFASCNKEDNHLIGTWKATAGTVTAMGQTVDAMATDPSMKTLTMTFNEDGTFITSQQGEADQGGKWTLTDTKLTMSTTVTDAYGSEKTETLEWTINELTETLLDMTTIQSLEDAGVRYESTFNLKLAKQ